MMKKIALALILVPLLFSCGEKVEDVSKAEAPKLVSSSPADGATDVASDKLSLTLSFDQNVKCPSSGQKMISISPAGTIAKVTAYNTDVTISLEGLEASTSYSLTAPKGCISGFRDNPTDKDIVVSFTTARKNEVTPVNPDEIPQRGESEAWKMAERMAFGFNLGNQMDAYYNDVANETVWGNPKTTQQAFNKIKSYGIRTVRVPITWIGHIGEAPDYAIDEAWMDRVAEIVGYAENAGLMCIINTHHDENHNAGPAHWLDIKTASVNSAFNEQVKDEIDAVWTQIAQRFADKGDWLIFESFNEINDGGWGWSDAFRKNPQVQYDILNSWNQVFVDAVRATGGNNANRWLGVPGYASNVQLTLDGLVLPKDSAENRIMVAVHSYDPSSFCGAGTTGQYNEWGHTGAAGKKPAEDETTLRTMMATLYESYVAKGIPCYIGECGCVNKKDSRGASFQKYYLEYFAKAAYSFGMPCIIWDNGVAATDNGESFGFINHGSGEYIGNGAAVIPVMVKAQTNTSASYTLDSVYTNAPK